MMGMVKITRKVAGKTFLPNEIRLIDILNSSYWSGIVQKTRIIGFVGREKVLNE